MKMTESAFGGAQPPIDGYSPDGFRVGGAFFEGPVVLSAQGVAEWSAAADGWGALSEDAAAPLIALAGAFDVVLLGAGHEMASPPQPFREALNRAGVRFDVMSTPAACRTYNVLLTEDRRVAAALSLVGV